MESSRFSIALIAVLSVSLGAALTASPAEGYPGGAAISQGSNPVRSGSGSIHIESTPSTGDIIASTATQQLIITDLMIGFVQQSNHCRGAGEARLVGSDGVTYANIPVHSTTLNNAQTMSTQFSARSGFAIPTNTAVHLEWVWAWNECSRGEFGLAYNLTGYLSTP